MSVVSRKRVCAADVTAMVVMVDCSCDVGSSQLSSLFSEPVSLVVLVALNMLLFYKLYALERAAHTLERWHSYSVADR